ncbi:MAG: ABC transporter permease [Acidobacteriota bacterium]|nr:ABC transporter permease [Acidobacteriota bacterium]
MTILQALRYFAGEAQRNMRRSWKVSLLAILVTAVSLFLSGALFLLGANLGRSLGAWESQARIVIYLEAGARSEAVDRVEAELARLGGIGGWTVVSPEEAARRLEGRLPELGELLQGFDEEPLPTSIEVDLGRARNREVEVTEWLQNLEQLPQVAGVDDDRQWIRQIALASALLRAGAAIIGSLLIAGSAFIIASVIRLAALLHREEIRVLRLVGATEFFVRGPFIVEGILQGTLGSAIAVAALSMLYLFVERSDLPSIVRSLLFSSFLTPGELLLLAVLGIGAGLVGGLLSVRKTAAGLW